MCRMSLVLSDNGPVTDLDMMMHASWGKSNPHGVGTLYRDVSKSWQLRRYGVTSSYKKIDSEYDRLLIHFRYGTGGVGTHPFTCGHAPNWYVVHNGMLLAEGHFRKSLTAKGHEYQTAIDSENFAHIWGDIYKPTRNLGKMATEMMSMVAKYQGSKNVILYNNETDEWVAISDGSLFYVKMDGFLMIASDFAFLPNAEYYTIKYGDIIYGKGTKILGESKWSPFVTKPDKSDIKETRLDSFSNIQCTKVVYPKDSNKLTKAIKYYQSGIGRTVVVQKGENKGHLFKISSFTSDGRVVGIGDTEFSMLRIYELTNDDGNLVEYTFVPSDEEMRWIEKGYIIDEHATKLNQQEGKIVRVWKSSYGFELFHIENEQPLPPQSIQKGK